jgi:hypothetical protein
MTLRKTDGQIARARKEWKLMSNVDFNMIEALIAQEPIGNLMQIKDIVDKEIQFCRNNMAKQAVQQETAAKRAIPRMEGQLRRADRTDEFDNLKTQAGIGAVDPRIQTVLGTGLSDVGQESLKANYQESLHRDVSGATSGEKKIRYDLMLRSVLEAYSRRLTAGANKHGDNNYLKGLDSPTFIRERINHLYHHVLALNNIHSSDIETPQDNLDAILWNAGFLCEVLCTENGMKLFYEVVTKPNYTRR